MKILIDRKTFAQALSDVLPFAPSKAPIQILKNAKITTKGNKLKMEAHDSQTSMVKYIDTIECDEDASFLINILDLNTFVSRIKGNTIEITIEGSTLTLKHDKGKAEFQIENYLDYPSFKKMDENAAEIQIPSNIFANAVSNGRGFVSNDSLRPQMSAIFAYIENGDKFGYCATDTHKLIHGWYDIESIECSEIHWLIMPSAFRAIVNACKNSEVVKISITDGHVAYRFNDTIISTIQANGNFPNFKRVIPENWTMECSVDKQDLMDSLGRVALFCDNSECVKFNITRMDMTLSVDNLDYMKKSVETLSHGGCSGDITIGANVNHILTSVAVLASGEVLMRMDNASRPILFASPDNDKLQIIAMPMQLIS